MMNDTDLSTILVSAEHLASYADDEMEGLPKVDRSLRQVLDATNELWSKVTSSGHHDSQANVLMSSKGIDLPYLSQKLDQLSSTKTSSPMGRTYSPDVESYLKNVKENAILSVIDASHQRFRKKFEKLCDEELKKDAEIKRNEILNSLHGLSEVDYYIPSARKTSSRISTLSKVNSPMDQHQLLYAEKLMAFNGAEKTALNHQTQNLIQLFASCFDPQKDSKVYELWDVLNSMSEITVIPGVDVLKQRNSESVVEELIKLAKKYLEKKYRVFMENAIASSFSEACRGGKPTTYSLIKAYVKVTVNGKYLGMEHIFVDGLPFWPVLYYSLRCGCLKSALQAVQDSGMEMQEITELLNELSNSGARHLPAAAERNFFSYYKESSRTSQDPYKKLAQCALAACSLEEKHEEIIRTIEDYLWLKLCQVRHSHDITTQYVHVSATTSNHFTYAQLQSKISLEYGETYFNASEQPHVYFIMLALTGQFETAIDVLFRSNSYHSHAVHMAIALHQQHLLALSDNISRPILSSLKNDPEPLKRLNLCAIVKTYVTSFQELDVEIAMHYYYTLRNLEVSCSENLFPHFVCELVLLTEQFDKILGYKEDDGCRVRGLIDQFATCDLAVKSVICEVAEAMEEKSKYIDAIKLYNLGGNYEKVMRLMNILMSRHMTDPKESGEQIRKQLYEMSERFLSQVEGTYMNVGRNTVATFHTMRKLYDFFHYCLKKEYNLALEVIESSKLIPFSSEQIEPIAKSFKSLDDLISRLLPDVLIAVMTILLRQYDDLKPGVEGFEKATSRDKTLEAIRNQANIVTRFAGRIPFQLPGDTNSRLVQMEMMMLH